MSGQGKILPLHFYTRHDVLQVAKDLLGKVLVTHIDGITTAAKIVETEAYRAPDDKACHAYNNRHTARTEIMFAQGGVAYVYLCYGIHHLFNVVTAEEGMAHAVLIRGVEPIDNVEAMLQRRSMNKIRPQLTAGPGVLSKALGITTDYNGTDLRAKNSAITIEDRGFVVQEDEIGISARIGVESAGESATWPWRFFVKGCKWVSRGKWKMKNVK